MSQATPIEHRRPNVVALIECELPADASLPLAEARWRLRRLVTALRLWRAVKSFGRTATAALGDLTRAAAATEAHATEVTGRTERLTCATERLQRSLDRLAVLRSATADVRRVISGARGAVPRK